MSAPGIPTFRRPQFRRRRTLGLSLVEILISLGIAATLLTAAAAAFSASSDIVQTNEEFFRATQAARVCLLQITTQVRRGSVDKTSTTTNLNLITAANDDGSGEDSLTYKFVPLAKQLVLVTNDDPADPDYVLANNVTFMKFDVEQKEDPVTKVMRVVRVNVTVTVKVGGNHVTLTGSAAPRRNLVY